MLVGPIDVEREASRIIPSTIPRGDRLDGHGVQNMNGA